MQTDAQISSILSGWENHLLNDYLDDRDESDKCGDCGEDVRECDCAPEPDPYDRWVDEQFDRGA